MPIDKQAYLRRLNKTGNRPETKNQALLAEIAVDQLDLLKDILDKLEDIRQLLAEA